MSMRSGCGNLYEKDTPPMLTNSGVMLRTGGAQFSWQALSTWRRD
jgi:hypothetical protein